MICGTGSLHEYWHAVRPGRMRFSASTTPAPTCEQTAALGARYRPSRKSAARGSSLAVLGHAASEQFPAQGCEDMQHGAAVAASGDQASVAKHGGVLTGGGQ
jgi:hypothetical protein